MRPLGERLFALLLLAYPRAFRRRYGADLLAFFRHDRLHARYGTGHLRPLRFWASTIRDLARVAAAERWRDLRFGRRFSRRQRIGGSRTASLHPFAVLRFDLRNAVRSLRTTPGVTVTALLVLTLGIGASTAIFSVVDGIVLRGLPFADEASLMAINETDLATNRPVTVAQQNFDDWTERQDVFESLAASASGTSLTTADSDRPERLRAERITANLLEVLKVRPALGRGFAATDVAANSRLALLSDGLWRRRFQADPNVIGRTIAFESGVYEIAGVMPPGFTYPIGSTLLSAVDLWIPYVPEARNLTRTGGRTYFLRVIGRLKPGLSISQASSRMTQIRDVLAREHPRWFVDRGIVVRPLKDSIVSADVRSWMLMLLSAVAGVLLIACVNVANVLLVRATGRVREMGVRAAMGATRLQLVRGLIVESVLLTLGGAAGGLLIAYAAVGVLRATLPAGLPRVWQVTVDLRVIVIASLAAVATGVLCGLLPALRLSKTDVSAALRSGTRNTAGAGHQRLRTAFLVSEVALAAILLVGAGVFVSSFVRLIRTDLGFESERVFTVSVSPKLPAGAVQNASAALFQTQMTQALERIRLVPGVESAALLAGGVPLTGSWSSQPVHVAGTTFTDDDEVVLKQMTAGYLETIGATLLSGRSIRNTDGRGAPLVVVLNDEAVRRYLNSQNPLGTTLRIDDEAPRTVVGVIRGMRLLGPETEIRPEAYVPFEQSGNQSVSASLVIRRSEGATAVLPAIKDAIWTVLPGAVIPDVRTFDEMFAGLVAQRKLNMILLGIFGALALLIASIGVYGVMAYLVEQRTREIGVRIALGAAPSRILNMILSRATLTLAAGLALGFIAAAFLERIIMAFVFRGVARDPVVYGMVALLVSALGLVAAYVPARRAARVDPLRALRLDS